MALIKEKIKPESRCLIFCNKKYVCDELEQSIWQAGFNVAAIHGDKTQVSVHPPVPPLMSWFTSLSWVIAETRSSQPRTLPLCLNPRASPLNPKPWNFTFCCRCHRATASGPLPRSVPLNPRPSFLP